MKGEHTGRCATKLQNVILVCNVEPTTAAVIILGILKSIAVLSMAM